MDNGNGSCIGDRAEKELQQVTNNFERLIQDCPPELRGRQRVLRQRRGDFVFVEILTSFKILKPEGQSL
jgi:hypothetical protein